MAADKRWVRRFDDRVQIQSLNLRQTVRARAARKKAAKGADRQGADRPAEGIQSSS
jgi:hypothetical protein